MPKIVGIVHSSFTPKDSTTLVEGTTFYITDPLSPKRGVGLVTDRFFMSKDKVQTLSFVPDVGMEVELLYNRYGKVGSLRLLSDSDNDIPLDI